MCLADHARGVNWPFLTAAPVGGFAIALRQTQRE